MRSKLTNTIFRDEMKQIYERKDIAYKDLVEAAQDAMRDLVRQMQHQIYDNPVIEENMRQLVQALETTTGKKQYGYLKKPLKLLDTKIALLKNAAKLYHNAIVYTDAAGNLIPPFWCGTARRPIPQLR